MLVNIINHPISGGGIHAHTRVLPCQKNRINIDTYPRQTSVRNFMVRSTTSNQTADTVPLSKRSATGISWRIPNASWSTSVQRSLSSPDLHARLRKAKAKERAALAPTLASPDVARLLGDSLCLIMRSVCRKIIK